MIWSAVAARAVRLVALVMILAMGQTVYAEYLPAEFALSGNPGDSSRIADLKARCQSGDGPSCKSVGDDYYDQYGPHGDEAVVYYDRGCTLRDETSCYNAGTLLWNGDNATQDEPRAVAYMKKACAMGDKDACDFIPDAQSVLADKGARDRCDANDAVACVTIGNKLIGIGLFDGPKAITAIQFWEEGCGLNQGPASGQACDNAGRELWNGTRVQMDRRKAQDYFGSACSLGNKDGCANKLRTAHYFDKEDHDRAVAACKKEQAHRQLGAPDFSDTCWLSQ